MTQVQEKNSVNVQQLIKPNKKIFPQIYAYTTPDNLKMNGWIKIGYTERKDVKKRIWEQTHTANIDAKIEWKHDAFYADGHKPFTDHDFHRYLESKGIERDKGTEWFNFNGNVPYSEQLFREFIFKNSDTNYQAKSQKRIPYKLRDEQEEAVQMTMDYAQEHPNSEFLWNAKPRFGKTLSTYDFINRMDYRYVLIVTNRPAIANSWYEDFEKFIANNGKNYKFVSELDSLKGKALSRNEWIDCLAATEDTAKEPRQIAFVSLQDLKGASVFGGMYDKLEWVATQHWDLLVIDEAHEGVDTLKTDVAFDKINRQFTLHLSGTPFKALANDKFAVNQIYNWSYLDEQTKKRNLQEEDDNPYRHLPEMQLFTYQMSSMLGENLKRANLEAVDDQLSFDLNEFFAADEIKKNVYKFKRESEVKKWLLSLTTNEKYPFSTEELRNQLKHTFWRFDRVNSAKAMKQLLEENDIFKDYHIIVAAGDGKTSDNDLKGNAYQKVKEAIEKYDKTITLSVGQLSTGVTVPEWSAVLMLCNLKSPAEYIQTAFRVQNPWIGIDPKTGESYCKEVAYIFDFAPQRTLQIYDDFACQLSNQSSMDFESREKQVKKLLNFFPVIGEDVDGTMVKLEADQVLSLPQKIKANSVVSHGFMDNLLFANIHRIFGAPQEIKEILEQAPIAEQGRVKKKEITEEPNIQVSDDGSIDITKDVNKTYQKIFGGKEYELSNHQPIEKMNDDFENLVSDIVKEVTPAYQLSKKEQKQFVKKAKDDLKHQAKRVKIEIKSETSLVENQYKEQIKNAGSLVEKQRLKKERAHKIQEIRELKNEELREYGNQLLEETPKKIIEAQEKRSQTKLKNEYEEEIRGHLRGFSRTIPSFIMAYGSRQLTLQNFDKVVPASVFEEVTGITIEQFKLLRDGGIIEHDGNKKHFEGHLFDEEVFNQSIQTFLDKKEELSNYFTDKEEDIFDYIPPQKTNQIYTPKKVVIKMVDDLEKENPDIFNDSTKTFIDLYMKSGLYITEIVKRLYNSDQIKKEYPDNEQRLTHILENQVFGFAPTEIIYNIATEFIFGLHKDIRKKNFICVDALPYAEQGKIQELVDKYFD